jgi:SnoaL-like domain
MSNPTQLIDRYIAVWNETDPARRRDLIAQTWTETATYVDPMLESERRSGIDAMVEGVQQRFPGHRFRRTGDVEIHHDRVCFTWELAPEGGAPIVSGTDFGILAGERLQSVTGFFDKTPAQPAS